MTFAIICKYPDRFVYETLFFLPKGWNLVSFRQVFAGWGAGKVTRGNAGDRPGEPYSARWATRRDRAACRPLLSPPCSEERSLGGKEGPRPRPLGPPLKGAPPNPCEGEQRSHQRQGPEVNPLDNRKGRCPAWLPSPKMSVTCSRPRRRFTCSESHPREPSAPSSSPREQSRGSKRRPRSKETDVPLTLLHP